MGLTGDSYARCHPYPIPQPLKVGNISRVHIPYPSRTVVWVLLHPTDQWKCWETRPTVFHPYPRRWERVTICSCHYKGRTFFSVILRTWVLVRFGFEPTTSCSAAWCCPNRANQTAVNKMQGQIYKNDNLDIDWSNTHQSHMFTNYSSYSYYRNLLVCWLLKKCPQVM